MELGSNTVYMVRECDLLYAEQNSEKVALTS